MKMYAQLSRHKIPRLIHGGIVSKLHENSKGKVTRFSSHCSVRGEGYTGCFGTRRVSFDPSIKSMKFDEDIPSDIRDLIQLGLDQEYKRRELKRAEIVKEIKFIQESMKKKLGEDKDIHFGFQDAWKRNVDVNLDYYPNTGGFNTNLIQVDFETLLTLIRLKLVEKEFNPYYLKHGYYKFVDEESFLSEDIQDDFSLDIIRQCS